MKSHPLEHNTGERDYFEHSALHSNTAAAYRRAVEALTGSLPTWAQRKAGGRPRKAVSRKYGGDPSAAR
ncbi:hypothetical protein RSP673_010480 [Ralstonia solanacearum P673]|uniref:hypothetical protein n=1 Tax=Ralstonia solanacearum TaxID=305 RepID=UPI001268D3ED|nr:hypothetical protein [Ralstonia solanacearum]MCL9849237.1 hypothetical protein [Ralstonia solanacearum]MCL9854825.1 hypothetical protein [Ralstonia solanacearum]MCL9861819.1 hypothetical protein [Ralstonia solanacearum]MCL9864491.1 hypothetical protein [Ralstonia solanacearum]MCL9868889.1 hypothetical protein [Ralstonia solanacearum]